MRLPNVRDVYDGAEEHEVLNSASAISFQVLFTLVPLLLVGLAIVGFLDLNRVWSDAAETLRPNMSDAAFQVIDDTVGRVLESKRPFWLTIGVALAVWRMSAAMRATMHALNLIYGVDEERSLRARITVSITLSLALTLLLTAALAIIYLLPVAVSLDGFALGALSVLVRWGAAAVLLLIGIALTIRHAPATPQPLGWVSVGSAICAVSWIGATVAFAFYVTTVANYGSVFGSFATLFILLTYLYLATAALLIGAEVDTQLRRSNGGWSGA